MKREKQKIELSMKLNIVLLVIFSMIMIWAIFLVRNKLLYNADEMGTYLAQSYANEEENRMSIYKMFLGLGSAYIDQQLEAGTDLEQVQEWLETYSQNMTDVLGGEIIDPYAVIDGQIVAAVPWDGDGEYAYQETEWYQRAMEADGDVIFTNAYMDAITGKELVTLAEKLDGEGNVLAFDILLENFHLHKNKTEIPEDSSYFLYDDSGQLIYMVSDLDIATEEVQEYTQRLLENIQSGSLESHSASIKDMEGQNRGVYYYVMDNGWLSVITIPFQNILNEDWDHVIVIMFIIYLAIVFVILTILIKSMLGNRKMRYVSDTLRILGDTYYAIYRVNYETGTYESVKSSDDVKEALGSSGEYQHLIDVVKEVVDEKTYNEFEQSFSAENIRKLIQEKIYEFGGDYQRKFGDTYKWVSIKIIYNKALGLNEVLMCYREIDAEKRKQLQQQILLENALKSAKKTVKQKSSFFSNISHDMRTPLNAIIGLSELARKNPEKSDEYMEKIEQSGRQLLTLVNDVLDMSRIEHGEESSLDYAPMNLEKCIKDSVALFEEQAEKDHKSLICESEIHQPMVFCDKFRLNQIMNNLLSNALKYSTEGAQVTVRLKQVDQNNHTGKYQIEVEDTGIGMSEAFLERIFEPFARETVFAPMKVSGTGLGMPIVKSLVQQMSGEITVFSELGKGSLFTVILPLQIIGEEEQPEESGEMQEASCDLNGKRILVAEDNEINMEIATECLTMMGAEVLQAYNGREAVDIFASLEEGYVDAILMDMQMPEMDGCTACRRIRALKRKDARTVPVIAVTANAFAEDIAKTTEAGMNAHIAKPIDFGLLAQVIGECTTDAGL